MLKTFCSDTVHKPITHPKPDSIKMYLIYPHAMLAKVSKAGITGMFIIYLYPDIPS
jgi:hypothetical protein